MMTCVGKPQSPAVGHGWVVKARLMLLLLLSNAGIACWC